ncbi:Tryptophan synthase alpha chain [Minicystis rosea]|nr:Tryptophan synthase alpha chain [Minicystis rosea]
MAQIAISQVPSDGSVGCIVVKATGSHSVSRSVDVFPGQATVFDMNGLPVGTVSFLGNAYQGSCAAMTPASSPTWISDAVLASVSNVQPVMVHLSMHRNGKAGVDVDFEDDPTCRTDGAPCLGDAECCSQSCVSGACSSAPPLCPPGLTSCNGSCFDLMYDWLNCGACSNQCPLGTGCLFGVCTVASSCADAIKNGAETDVDCGGPCPACAVGNACQVGADCISGLCLNNICAPLGCQTPSDCPGADTECHMRTCTAGTCGFAFAPAGTAVSTQTPGDCHVDMCDGSGSILATIDYSDVPDYGNECTIGMCTFGFPMQVPAAAGTACFLGFGACDGTGNCISFCMDGMKNGAETDVDCGGASCSPCGDGKACMINADCVSGLCDTVTHVCSG